MRRRYLITAAVALAAAGVTVGLTLATRTTPPKPHKQAGRPPLVLDFGVRTDAEAVALRRAADLYDAGKIENLLLAETPIVYPYWIDGLTASTQQVNGLNPTSIAQLYLNAAYKSA